MCGFSYRRKAMSGAFDLARPRVTISAKYAKMQAVININCQLLSLSFHSDCGSHFCPRKEPNNGPLPPTSTISRPVQRRFIFLRLPPAPCSIPHRRPQSLISDKCNRQVVILTTAAANRSLVHFLPASADAAYWLNCIGKLEVAAEVPGCSETMRVHYLRVGLLQFNNLVWTL
jgi:hypothetical protein